MKKRKRDRSFYENEIDSRLPAVKSKGRKQENGVFGKSQTEHFSENANMKGTSTKMARGTIKEKGPKKWESQK